jgi:hypothetical protein
MGVTGRSPPGAIRDAVGSSKEATMAWTGTLWPGLDEETLDPRILDEMEPADPPPDEGEDDDGSESAMSDLGVSEDEDEDE